MKCLAITLYIKNSGESADFQGSVLFHIFVEFEKQVL